MERLDEFWRDTKIAAEGTLPGELWFEVRAKRPAESHRVFGYASCLIGRGRELLASLTLQREVTAKRVKINVHGTSAASSRSLYLVRFRGGPRRLPKLGAELLADVDKFIVRHRQVIIPRDDATRAVLAASTG